LIGNKDEILEGYEGIIQALTDTSKLDKESKRLQDEIYF
jgi:site-specific DNA recombinase